VEGIQARVAETEVLEEVEQVLVVAILLVGLRLLVERALTVEMALDKAALAPQVVVVDLLRMERLEQLTSLEMVVVALLIH
jgi:hypothetical protein